MFRLMKNLDIEDKNNWKAWNMTQTLDFETRIDHCDLITTQYLASKAGHI